MIFESFHTLLFWAVTFGIMAWVLWRWGSAGGPENLLGLTTATDLVKKFFQTLWFILTRSPALTAAIAIIIFIMWIALSGSSEEITSSADELFVLPPQKK